MRLLPGSMRARVTFVTAAGAVGALAVCLVLLYAALDGQLWAAIDDGLAARAGDLTAGGAAALAGDPMAQRYRPDGTLTAGSATLRNRRLLTTDQVRHLGTTPPAASERSSQVWEGVPASVAGGWGGDPVFVTRAAPIGAGGGTVSVRLLVWRAAPGGDVLVVGVSAEPVHAARERLALVLFLAAPVLAGALAAGAWAVVRAALRPVDALTRQAAAISSLETAAGPPQGSGSPVAGGRLAVVGGEDEIARLARTLNDMLARLGAAAERERAFVDDASHELRTPLAVLRGELELALGALGDDEEVEHSLLAALGEAERLSRLADDLLLLARERAGTLVVRAAPVDLLELAAAEARRLRPALGVGIEAGGEPVVVSADEERLRQVLANLAANSAAAGAATVRVRVARDGESAVLEVADDGPGLPPALLDAAFARFIRGDDARATPGAGLGLSIVRAVGAAHGGTVTAANGAPLGGAVITVRFPAE
ncbi:HAMP domain-containing sensor histidine kinase [Nonomuraea sp. NPDC050643]|uniref:HAMP domain-containing sensor histidine kinase n=1 Tax=Nonomuraea sp. NPDC050643 TaxID=3155660 RepID=UPI0033CD2368